MGLGEVRLVTVLGTTPAIVTETLYALSVTRKPKAKIDRIELITTRRGKERANAILEQKIGQLCGDYGLEVPEIVWHLAEIEGQQCEDIVDDRDSEAAAKLIHKVIREACTGSAAVYASLAGGRKTMSYYLGLAMSFYARQNDQLYHVLVPPALENSQGGFFYPNPGELSQIELPELPFPRLRGYLERSAPRLYEQTTAFSDIVEAANIALGPTLPLAFTLIVDTKKREMWIEEDSGRKRTIAPSHARLFEVLIRLNSTPQTLNTLIGEGSEKDKADFLNYFSVLNRMIEEQFGHRARILFTKASKSRPATYYLPPGMKIEERTDSPISQ